MSWKAQGLFVVNAAGDVVATCAAYDNPENAAKRAVLFSLAPRLLDTLCELVEVGERSLPEHLQVDVRKARELLKGIQQ